MKAIPEGEAIYETWKEHSSVQMIHLLDDIAQPYTCEMWGDSTGTSFLDEDDEYPEIQNIPPIINDGNLTPLRDLFPPGAGNIYYPITIFMDHNMRIIHIEHGSINLNDAKVYINCMLEAM